MRKQKDDRHKITSDLLPGFIRHLRTEERGEHTIKKYANYVQEFLAWLDGGPVTKAAAVEWKNALQEKGTFAPATINARIASINVFFKFAGWDDCRIKALRLQRRMFRDPDRDLTREEYERLISTAYALGDERLALVMETICATGIRVSEVKYITVEAVGLGRAIIDLKGKIRTIIIPGKLRKKLKKYIQKMKIAFGEIFLTRNGRGLSRRQIWAEMKAICKTAGVEPSKVFPHNLRHLFAKVYYRVYRDIVKLADILGHSSIGTTRIYLISTGTEHAEQLDRLDLIY